MASIRALPGILGPLANDGVVSLEQISDWARSIEKRTGQRVSPYAALKEHAAEVDEADWIYAAHTATKLPYHPIGNPDWLNPNDHSKQCLRHYEDHNGIVLYTLGRLIYVGMLDASQEGCEEFKKYYETWWQFRFAIIGPAEYLRAMGYLEKCNLVDQRPTSVPPLEEDAPIFADTEIATIESYLMPNTLSAHELAYMSSEDIRDDKVIPIRKTGPLLWIGTTTDNWREQKRRRLRAILGLEPKPIYLSEEDLNKYVALCLKAKKLKEIPKAIQKGEVRHKISSQLVDNDSFNEATGQQSFHKILATAVAEGASDIHIERGDISTQIIMRIDGALETFSPLDTRRGEELVGYIKQETGLFTKSQTGEGPADSNYSISIDERIINLRLASASQQMNGRWMEKIVIRILDPKNVKSDLDDTSISKADIDTLRRAISREKGIVLVTGPTGSGKSTTLVALIGELSNRKAKRSGKDNVIYTLEQPIEYQLTAKGVFQMQVDEDNNMGFGESLRALMRMDPDVILVQEIRDELTAKVALDASDTGHLVFSTLHTNNTINVFSRLTRGLKVPPEQILNNLILATAQRLYPKRCPECLKQEGGIWINTGCINCKNRGRKGRAVIIETLCFDDYPDARQLFLNGASEEDITKALKSAGWRSYEDQAKEMADAGIIEIL